LFPFPSRSSKGDGDDQARHRRLDRSQSWTSASPLAGPRTARGRHDAAALMASQARHDARTVEMMWTSDGDHHIPTPASCIPQVGRTILNPSRVSDRSNWTGSALRPWLKAAETINHLQGRRAVPRIPDQPTQVSRDSYRGRRPTLRRNCRNEHFIHTHISARNGILTYAASALLTIAVQSFQSFCQEIGSPI
jgi:hypothetical protein